MIIFISWIIFCILVAIYADSKGRSWVGYFFISLLLSPFIGFIIILIQGSYDKEAEQQKIEKLEKESEKQQRECPFCAENIRRRAKICRYCQNQVTPKYVDHEQANAQVVKILELRGSGLSAVEISQVFNDEGEIFLKDQSSWNTEKVNKVIQVFG